MHYEMPVGRRGPDVISVAPDGTTPVGDSKWRMRLNSTGGHQSQLSLELVQNQGRLSSGVGAKTSENAAEGNFFIIAVGTGNAHGGVMRSVHSVNIATRSK